MHEAAAALSRRSPLGLASEGSATVGGVISTNACGTQVLRNEANERGRHFWPIEPTALSIFRPGFLDDAPFYRDVKKLPSIGASAVPQYPG